MCLPRRDARDNCDHHDVADVARCSRRHRIGAAPDACPLHFHDDPIKAQTRQITPYINAKPLRLNTPVAMPTGGTGVNGAGDDRIHEQSQRQTNKQRRGPNLNHHGNCVACIGLVHKA